MALGAGRGLWFSSCFFILTRRFHFLSLHARPAWWFQTHMVLRIGNAGMQQAGGNIAERSDFGIWAMIPPLAYGCGGYLGDCLFMPASCVWHHLSLFNGMHRCGWQAKTDLTWRAFCAAVFCYFFASLAGFYTGAAFSGKGSWRGKAQARLNALMPGYLALFLIDMTSDHIHP